MVRQDGCDVRGPRVAKIVGEQFFYFKLDVGRFDQHTDCLKQYGVQGIPTLIAFNPDGSARLSKDSYVDPAAFKVFLAKAAGTAAEASSADSRLNREQSLGGRRIRQSPWFKVISTA